MKTKASIVLGICLCIVSTAFVFAAESRHATSPGVRTLGSISEKYNAVTFDHEKHVSIAGACNACHHHPQSASTCKECHGLTPAAMKDSVVQSFMPCSNCHAAYDRENPAMPGLKVAYHKKCFGCHRGMGNLGSGPEGCTELCHARKGA